MKQNVVQNLQNRQVSLLPIQSSSANNSIDLTDEEEAVTRPQATNPPALVAMNSQAQLMAKQNSSTIKHSPLNTVAYIVKSKEAPKQINVNRMQLQYRRKTLEFNYKKKF